ncbi:MAG: DUF7931 domain-containing protein [Gammaproteobacteria bacterium]|jgi:hypothetical protein
MDGLDKYQLGETDELLRITTRDDCQDLSLALARQAKRSLAIFSYDLEPALYNSPGFYEAARDVIGSDPNASIRILVYDISRTINNGHRLLDLSRRLSSCVQIRKLTRKYHHAFLVADNIGVLDRRRAERYEATANFNSPSWANNLLHFFNVAWDQSSRSSEVLSLNI